MTAEMSSKTDPRVIRTRKLIEEAFIAFYRTKPLKDITVSDITTAAGINRATFYKHFQDKFALYDSYIKTCFDEYLGRYLPEDAPLNKENFRHLTYATILFIKDWQATRTVITDQTDTITETRVQQTVFDQIMYWIEPNYMKGPCDAGAEVAASAVSWAVFGVGVRLAQQKADISVEDVTDELVRMLTGGLWNALVDIHEKAFGK